MMPSYDGIKAPIALKANLINQEKKIIETWSFKIVVIPFKKTYNFSFLTR